MQVQEDTLQGAVEDGPGVLCGTIKDCESLGNQDSAQDAEHESLDREYVDEFVHVLVVL